MDNHLKKAQNLLLIKCVNVRSLESSLKDNFFADDFSPEKYDRQSYKAVRSLNEREVEIEKATSDSVTSYWNYRFCYSIGLRFIDTNDSLDEDIDSSDDAETLLEIQCDFEADYISKEKLSFEEIKAFSKNNVGYHVWPYWRELVQSTCSRMGIKSCIDVPTYTIEHDSDES